MQKIINTGKADILVIGSPNYLDNLAIATNIINEDCHILTYRDIHKFGTFIKIPKDNYTLLGIYPDNLTEEQAALVIDKDTMGYYKNHTGELKYHNYTLKAALESFATLMEANKCYIVNPHGDERSLYQNYGKSDQYITSDEKFNKWQQAQSRTFDKWAVVLINKK